MKKYRKIESSEVPSLLTPACTLDDYVNHINSQTINLLLDGESPKRFPSYYILSLGGFAWCDMRDPEMIYI